MAQYIALLKFTAQGSKNIKASTTRALAFDKLAAKAGVKVEGQYWTVGRYDGVLILSAANQSTALKAITKLAAAGDVTTNSLQAFDAKEFSAIAGG